MSKYERPENHLCAYCLGPGETWDHVTPRISGGTNHADNLLRACNRCNTAKGPYPLVAFLALRAAGKPRSRAAWIPRRVKREPAAPAMIPVRAIPYLSQFADRFPPDLCLPDGPPTTCPLCHDPVRYSSNSRRLMDIVCKGQSIREHLCDRFRLGGAT